MFSWISSWYYGAEEPTEQELEQLSESMAVLGVGADRSVYIIGVNKDCTCAGMRRRNFGVYSNLQRALVECTLIAVQSGCAHLEVRRNRLDCPRNRCTDESRWFFAALERAEEEGNFCAKFATSIEQRHTAGPTVSLDQYRAWVAEHGLDASPVETLEAALQSNKLERYSRRAVDSERMRQ